VTTPVVRRTLAALTLVAVLPLTGCAGGPPTVDPTGVDELTVPTPSPDPEDFVGGVDNPWFPLEPGTGWSYRVTGEGDGVTERVTVADRSRVVMGVRTVAVHDVVEDAHGRVVEDTWRWYAQDRRGNVWTFGEDTTAYDGKRADTEGSWEAGVDGAEAGLVMPAEPRLGDGFVQESSPGVAEGRAEVLSLDEQREVPLGGYDHLVQVEETTPLDPGLLARAYYARGTGLVLRETIAGGAAIEELVAVSRP
jgi:hypothetical protein